MFELAPWRKPPLADDGLVVGLGGPALVVALGAAFVGPSFTHAPDEVVWAGTAAALAGVLALAWLVGHPPYGRGRIAFEGGVLHLDTGRGAPITVPVSAIRGAIVQRFADAGTDRLVLYVDGRPLGLTIRLTRLVDPLDALLFELRSQVARHGDLDAFDRHSQWQVNALVWTLAACGAVAVLAALWALVD